MLREISREIHLLQTSDQLIQEDVTRRSEYEFWESQRTSLLNYIQQAKGKGDSPVTQYFSPRIFDEE